MITIENIENIKTPPVSPDELREAYETLRQHCRECYDSDGCDYCRLQGLCRDNLQPRFWPGYESLQYGQEETKKQKKGTTRIRNKQR